MFAVRDVHTGEVHHFFYDWKNSYVVIDFLQKLMQIYEGRYLYIIWDGWSAHNSEATKAFIDLHPRIKILPLPTRASWLNPIERDFSKIQRFVLNNSKFNSVKELIEAVGDYITKELSSN